eukprot:5539979-Prorocentrum_lima.AAC.1
MVLSLEIGVLRNAFAMSVVVNVLLFPLVMLNIVFTFIGCNFLTCYWDACDSFHTCPESSPLLL